MMGNSGLSGGLNYILYIYIYLVGGFSPPLWKIMQWKSVGMMKFPIWKDKKCSKPPTRCTYQNHGFSRKPQN
jgi:hypothetical protein